MPVADELRGVHLRRREDFHDESGVRQGDSDVTNLNAPDVLQCFWNNRRSRLSLEASHLLHSKTWNKHFELDRVLAI